MARKKKEKKKKTPLTQEQLFAIRSKAGKAAAAKGKIPKHTREQLQEYGRRGAAASMLGGKRHKFTSETARAAVAVREANRKSKRESQ